MTGEPDSPDRDDLPEVTPPEDDVTTLAMALGILQERYHLSTELASRLLSATAARIRRPHLEIARHLIRTRVLPSGI